MLANIGIILYPTQLFKGLKAVMVLLMYKPTSCSSGIFN